MFIVESCKGCVYDDQESEYYDDYCIKCSRNPNHSEEIDLYVDENEGQ